ncbi:MAG: hypothetical protein ACR2MS_04215 [Weeksellaceae bacterium]
MQFYKHRSFGELISDTFEFVRQYGKNYFKNYFLMNGAVLLLLLLVVGFGYGELIGQFFGSNLEGQQYYFEQYFSENQGVFITVTVLVFILFILLSMVTYSFPVLYMRRLANHSNERITTQQIVNDLKAVWIKFLIFTICLLVIFMPIAIVLFLISGFLMIILIGFFLLMLLFPVMMNIVNFTLFDYYHSSYGFFKAVRFAIKTQFSNNFFKYWSSVSVVYMIIQIITTIFTMIPMIFVFGGFMVNPMGGEEGSMMAIIYAVVYGVSIFASFILSNLIYINAGLMYYDAKTEYHKDVQLSEIESLGTL